MKGNSLLQIPPTVYYSAAHVAIFMLSGVEVRMEVHEPQGIDYS